MTALNVPTLCSKQVFSRNRWFPLLNNICHSQQTHNSFFSRRRSLLWQGVHVQLLCFVLQLVLLQLRQQMLRHKRMRSTHFRQPLRIHLSTKEVRGSFFRGQNQIREAGQERRWSYQVGDQNILPSLPTTHQCDRMTRLFVQYSAIYMN